MSNETTSNTGRAGKKPSISTRCLAEAAVLVAMAQILSYIKLYQFPNGGSVTVATFPLILFAVRWGLKPGLLACFAYGALQLIFDGAYAWGWASMLLDYLLAFTPLGLAGLFQGRKWGIFAGAVVGCSCRFLIHFISGITVYRILVPTEVLGISFANPYLYSLAYNGSYMLANTVLALVISGALYVPLKRYILAQDLAQ